MASTLNASFCAIVILAFLTAVGLPVTRRLLAPTLALPFAPLTGWVMQSVLAVPIFYVVPFTKINVTVVGVLLAVLIGYAARIGGRNRSRGSPGSFAFRDNDFERDANAELRVSPWAWIGALLLATTIAAAILPKHVGDAVILSDQIFDHAKVAIINDMTRVGLPPGNPFFAHDGSDGTLAYYYLWHFSAAELAKVFNVTGWEADVAMTFFSAFTSLAIMMALAVRYGRRASGSIWVVVIAATCSSRVIFETVFGLANMEDWIPAPGGLGGWMFQSVWVPQHLIACSCVLLSVLLLNLPMQGRRVLTVIVLALSIAGAFESSTWVGGIVFALACIVLVPMNVVRTESSQRAALLASLLAVLVLSLLLAWPFIDAEAKASLHRYGGSPIALHPFAVLGTSVPISMRALLNIPAYWLILLPIELPGVYLVGLFVMKKMTVGPRSRNDQVINALVVVTLMSLLVSCLLASTLADNNDLAWRAALLASTLLIPFAAMGVASAVAKRQPWAVILACVGIALGLPEAGREIYSNFVGDYNAEGRVFAEAPAMWAAIRDHSDVTERVANNPMLMARMTPWPVNISWSLLSSRRSCYAGWELTQVYSSVPHLKLWAIDAQFKRVFDGAGTPSDVQDLATNYDCSLALVTVEDGAWLNDPFRDSPYFKLVEEAPEHWRLYRRVALPAVKAPS
jgi:hypothetical protein